MKRILITGAGSYIGTHIEAYLLRFPERYETNTLPMQSHTPDEYDFHGADAVIHVAAIVHRKETKDSQPLYDAVNRDLAVAVAEKAKREGVKQFVFFSTMAVYGMTEGTINRETALNPKTQYARSKLSAERRIAALSDDTFFVSILRPPMVFGPGAKGNPARLERLAKKLPFCPDFENRRSMVSIETLCGAVEALLDVPRAGVFFPQEPKPLATRELIERAMREQGRTPKRSKLLNPAIRVLRKCTSAGKKAFGDLVYEDLTELPLPNGEETR
ncbi:MAG: NAD-dependent epimerase/dehydratase family protein [Clostridia bacterium]|nr:NAD-dependent epimerase/dehydratase family protein [Clostridia bacterium]